MLYYVEDIQSVRFDKNKFSINSAKKWLKRHGYKQTFRGKSVDITPNQYRFRQFNPKRKRIRVVTINIASGVTGILYIR